MQGKKRSTRGAAVQAELDFNEFIEQRATLGSFPLPLDGSSKTADCSTTLACSDTRLTLTLKVVAQLQHLASAASSWSGRERSLQRKVNSGQAKISSKAEAPRHFASARRESVGFIASQVCQRDVRRASTRAFLKIPPLLAPRLPSLLIMSAAACVSTPSDLRMKGKEVQVLLIYI